MKASEIDKKVKTIMSKARYHHSLRVADLAVELAERHGVSKKKVKKAALLHDVGYFYVKDKKMAGLKHAALSVMYARHIGIDNSDILDAIKYHTLGSIKMNKLAKVLFLADKLEAGRRFEGVDIIRKVAFVDIDLALLLVIENTDKYLKKQNSKIHKSTSVLYESLMDKFFGENK